jgi:hypothetical protein
MTKKLNVLHCANLMIQAKMMNPTSAIRLHSETQRMFCMDSEAIETVTDAWKYILPELKDMRSPDHRERLPFS